MRRLARGATILASVPDASDPCASDPSAPDPSAPELRLTQRAGAAGPPRPRHRTAFAAGQREDALAYDYMAYALVPDLAGSPHLVQSAPGQQIRVRW